MKNTSRSGSFNIGYTSIKSEMMIMSKTGLRISINASMIKNAKVDVVYQLAERLQAEEQEQFTIEEKATLFKELLEKRRKHFAAKRAEGKRNKPPTKTQQKKTMITYLKNMEGWKHKDLKSKDFDSIKELFDKALKMVNMFVDFRTELVKETTEVDNDQEAAKINELMEIVPGQEEVKIDAIPLGVKSPSIVFSQMLKSFDRKDLEDLYKLVKAKYESTRPVEDLDLVLWNDLKSTFLKDATYADLNVGRKEGRIVGIKSSLMLFGVTAAHIDVNAD
ncbi:hypothetical protein Tco_1057936 [Tanacetum coccineum]|uniref:Uncharacterized protein n=1 Tax=Tanacetum coccineum TaxID=301880 RepID=A0ABQ5H875_9ASTR